MKIDYEIAAIPIIAKGQMRLKSVFEMKIVITDKFEAKEDAVETRDKIDAAIKDWIQANQSGGQTS